MEPVTPASATHLRPITRIFWLILTVGLGIIPSLLFFAWVERNMALPAPIYQWLGAPWIGLYDAALGVKLVWNFALFAAFGFFHSLLAQKGPQSLFRKIVPVQCVRPLYMSLCGMSCLAMIACWQSTGVIVWVVPGLTAKALSAVSVILYYTLFLVAMKVMTLFDPFEFLGLRQIYSRPEQIDRMSAGEALLETGIYSYVRHPIYFFTMAAFALTPMMSLDRFLLLAASILYLFFGIPIEERKLENRFGDAYRAYRTRVPAVIPRMTRISHIGSPAKTR